MVTDGSGSGVTTHDSGQIAIIGMSGRFPGAPNLDMFWANLKAGIESLILLSEEELIAAGVAPELASDPRYVRRVPLLDDIEYFDADFFGINPREAETIDPQHRLFLECAWHALEDAGYDPDRYSGPVGVYGGCQPNSYAGQLHRNARFIEQIGDVAVALGNDRDYLTARVSFKLDLTGPSLNLQAACATGLLAVCEASHALLASRCDMAIAGAAAVRVPQLHGYLYQPDGMFSPDGRCHVFDARARGAVFGNGVGVVVLKRLKDALADGDNIRAVLRGSAVTNDGASKDSFSAPTVAGQRRAVALAHRAAGISADTIDYVEAHGTGTAVGDPIEVAALTEAFGLGTGRRTRCALGAVKANVGHLDTAAGMAGLIKVVLALEHEQIPPNINFETPNPAIDFAASPFYVNTVLTPWRRGRRPRRAGVSAFGVGGTNVHLVVEEAPVAARSEPQQRPSVLVLSARSPAALDKLSASLSDHFVAKPDTEVADAAFTLQVGRRELAYRRAVVVRDASEAARVLREPSPASRTAAIAPAGVTPIVFMFPGQGSQYVGMSAGLYRCEPTFSTVVDVCAEMLTAPLGLDIRDVMYPREAARASAAARLGETAITQPALFVVEYALARLWQEWGIEPSAMLGHSLGEYVAATLAGVLSLSDALALTAERGKLMQASPPGIMLAVAMGEAEIRTLLDEQIDVAAINESAATVVAGSVAAMTALEATLAERRVPAVRLNTSHAFHSPMTDALIAPFRATVEMVPLAVPKLDFVSCVTGNWITDELAVDPCYWASHMRRTVRFADGLRTVTSKFAGRCVLLEVGPGHTLTGLAARASAGRGATALASLPGPSEVTDDLRHLLGTVGRLWTEGARINWAAGHRGQPRKRVAVPVYPLERRRYWVEGADTPRPPAAVQERPVKKPDVAEWFSVPRWEPSPPPELGPGWPDLAGGQQWLVFAGERGYGDELVAALRQAGAEPVVVRAGGGFLALDASNYQIDPLAPADYARLLKVIGATDGRPRRIVHCWLTERASPAPSTVDGLGAAAHELMLLAHALSELRFGPEDEIAVVTANAYAVTGAEDFALDNAAALGLCTVMAQEFHLACRLIDVTDSESPEPQGLRPPHWLLAELLGPRSDAPVAYRLGQRWVRTFEALRLGPVAAPSRRLRAKGVYLITGGLGAIGLQIARHLATVVQARLLLVGRSPLPPRRRWAKWLRGPNGDDATARKIRAVLEIERAGGRVRVVAADVTDRDQMAAAIRLARDEFGGLHGVIHAAGVASGGLLALKDPESAASVMAPKIAGALVLDELLRDAPLDFFLLCSSVCSIIGGIGQSDYCAANAFLDALAQTRRAQGFAAYQAVNWDTWREVGMAVDVQVPKDLQHERQQWLQLGMTNREGTETFERILESARPQIVVTTTGADTALRGAGALWKSPAVALPQSGITNYPRPDTASAFVAPRDDVESALATIWQDLLGIDAVGIHDDFFAELGGHSLLAAQVVSRVWETFGSDVSVRSFFEAPTIAELAPYVTSRKVADSLPEPVDISEPYDGEVEHIRSELAGEAV